MKLLADRRFRLAAIIALSMAAGSAMTSAAIAAQTHMLNARALLERADAQLQMAEADKGGYRLQAIGDVEQAIAAVNAGIQAGF
jgi:hypothetical protein